MSKITSNNFEAHTIKYEDLSPDYKRLLDSAEQVMHNSYSPYHKFMVGAALLTEDGKIISGTNVENAAGTSICAERSAILAANAQGVRDLTAIAVIGKGHEFDSEEVIAPCGFCRQVIYEAAQVARHNIVVIMSNSRKTKIVISTIDDLLPMAFGPQDVKVDLAPYLK